MTQTLIPTYAPTPTRTTIALTADEVELVLSLALDPDEETDTRVRAIEELADIADPRAGAACLRLLDDPEAAVRFWAVYALWQLALARRVDLADIAAPLHRVATTDTGVVTGWWSVRKEALDALVALGLLQRSDASINGFDRHRLDELRFARTFVAAAGLPKARTVEVANEVQVARSASKIAMSFAWLGAWTSVDLDGTPGAIAEAVETTARAWGGLLRASSGTGRTAWDEPA
ncbi:MAG: HEAT repeat domain-containing protein [Acidimicrobiia bacterium]